jgi:hypothetical protein
MLRSCLLAYHDRSVRHDVTGTGYRDSCVPREMHRKSCFFLADVSLYFFDRG